MIALYTTPKHDYFYCLWMDAERPSAVRVKLGEGPSPAEAVWDLSDTPYRYASFGCRVPSCDELCEYFDIFDDESDLVYSTDDEEQEAEKAFFIEEEKRKIHNAD